MEIYPVTKSCVDDKLEYDTVPMYTEEEKRMIGDIPTYNFDSILEFSPDNPNPKILFSNTYNHDETYRSMFALTEEQVRKIIDLLQRSLINLDVKKGQYERLNKHLKYLSEFIYNSFIARKEKGSARTVEIKYINKDSVLRRKADSNDFLLNVYYPQLIPYDGYVNVKYVNIIISIDDEVYNFIRSKKELKDFKFDDEFKNSIIDIFKNKFAKIIIDNYTAGEFKKGEKEEFFKYIHDDIIYQVVSLPEEYFMGVVEKVLDERKKAMEDVNKFLENMKKQNEPSFQNAILTTPAPIQNMSEEEMNKISREFLQSIETEE